MISLYPLKKFKYPVVAECISPDVFRGKKLEETAVLEVWEGNKRKKLEELFKLEETEGPDDAITIQGDVNRVKRIGFGMASGELFIIGDAGMHLGEEMKGGKIRVNGDAGSWAGSMMKGGEIDIRGNAGDYLGSPYRGSSQGMSGGRMTVHGNAGSEIGAYLKKGTIKICGNVGQFAGLRMQGGTIYVQGDCDGRVGACMRSGKIIVSGFLASILPTFTIDGLKEKVKVEEDETVGGGFYVFLGDLVEDGRGKLYVSRKKNSHLSHYERLL